MNKNIYSQLALILFFSSVVSIHSQTESSSYKYILDYNVPQSPAFTVLGVNPEKIVTGSASKPLMLNLLNQFVLGQKVDPGVAIDFSPFLFGIRLASWKEYSKKPIERIIANTLISVATIKNEEDSNSLSFGIGLRATIFDDFDLFQDTALRREIDNMLSETANAPDSIGEDKIGNDKDIIGLKEAYVRAKAKLSQKTGNALSFGYGLKGVLKSSYLVADSIDIQTHKIWIAGVRYQKMFNLFLNIQGSYSKSSSPDNLIGVGFKTNNYPISLGGECIYYFKKNKFDGGLSGQAEILTGIKVIVSINIENEEINGSYKPKLKLRTNLKWNLGQ